MSFPLRHSLRSRVTPGLRPTGLRAESAGGGGPVPAASCLCHRAGHPGRWAPLAQSWPGASWTPSPRSHHHPAAREDVTAQEREARGDGNGWAHAERRDPGGVGSQASQGHRPTEPAGSTPAQSLGSCVTALVLGAPRRGHDPPACLLLRAELRAASLPETGESPPRVPPAAEMLQGGTRRGRTAGLLAPRASCTDSRHP